MNQNRPFSLYKLSQMFVEVTESYHFTDKERYSKRTCLILQGPESVELEWYKKRSLCTGCGRLFGGRSDDI